MWMSHHCSSACLHLGMWGTDCISLKFLFAIISGWCINQAGCLWHWEVGQGHPPWNWAHWLMPSIIAKGVDTTAAAGAGTANCQVLRESAFYLFGDSLTLHKVRSWAPIFIHGWWLLESDCLMWIWLLQVMGVIVSDTEHNIFGIWDLPTLGKKQQSAYTLTLKRSTVPVSLAQPHQGTSGHSISIILINKIYDVFGWEPMNQMMNVYGGYKRSKRCV